MAANTFANCGTAQTNGAASTRLKARKLGRSRSKEVPGGAPAVGRLCGVSRQAIYTWIAEWRVERLVDALKLARATGIAIEKLAGPRLDLNEADVLRDEVERARAKSPLPMPRSRRR